MNHFENVCRSKTMKQVNFTETERPSENAYNSSSEESVFSIEQSSNSKMPSVKAKVYKTEIEFLIDTGASVNVINENVFAQMSPKPTLKKPESLVFAYGSSEPLSIKGYFQSQIYYKGKEVGAEFYVVENTSIRIIDPISMFSHSRCLLGSATAQALNIVHFAFSASCLSSIPDQYPSLFDGKMGKVKGVKVNLHINKDVPPVTQRHRRIPFHIRKDVETELKRLEDLDVIEKVNGPTPWVSPVVVGTQEKFWC